MGAILDFEVGPEPLAGGTLIIFWVIKCCYSKRDSENVNTDSIKSETKSGVRYRIVKGDKRDGRNSCGSLGYGERQPIYTHGGSGVSWRGVSQIRQIRSRLGTEMG